MKKILTYLASIALTLSLFTGIAFAAESGEMSIYPYEWDGDNEMTKYWYIYNIDIGGSHNDNVVVENKGSNKLGIKIYPVDALTTSDGAFALENEDEEKDTIGQWVTLDKYEIDLEPGQKEIIPFTISVPEDASPGEHIGGIIMENKELVEGNQLNVKTRVGVRIYQTVPGDVVKKMNIESITAKGQYNSIWSMFYDYDFDYNLINEGNVQIVPTITSTLSSSLFGEIDHASEEIQGSIFPGKSITKNFKPSKGIYFGPYTLTVTSQVDDQAPIQKSLTFWALPWKLCLIIGVVLLGGLSLFALDDNKPKKKRKTKKKSKTKKAKK